MLTYLTADDLSEPPLAFLDHVLPRPRETFIHHLAQTQKRLSNNAFDRKASLFASDERGPVSLLIASGEGDKRHIDLIAVRGDRRRRGLGRAMLEHILLSLRAQSVCAFVTSGVSSANTAAVGLLESAGFAGKPTGGIRMIRSLDDPLPVYHPPDGIEIRPIRPGEEAQWVELKNACFVGDGGREWRLDDFHKEFTQSPLFDRSRIFVALENNRMVGTTTAWEADYGEGKWGLIHWVGTRPECRGKGVGYAINLRALEAIAALGYANACLNTARWREPAVRLYERLGFHIHRETVHYELGKREAESGKR